MAPTPEPPTGWPPAHRWPEGTFLDLVLGFVDARADRANAPRVTAPERLGQPWIRVQREGVPTPAQGWKLHVSADAASAPEVLRRALGVLLDDGATFKVLGSSALVGAVNQGSAGPSQIGKFITVYPADDRQAVRLARSLDEATRGLAGPRIPSDRPLVAGSLVHYRYGGFDGRTVQTPVGEILPAMRDPSGRLVPDRRVPVYRPPPWVDDPFAAAGIAAELAEASPLVGGRYLIVGTLSASWRHTVQLAVDLETPRQCVLKRAGLGSDGHLRPHHEADVLARLPPDPRFPSVLDFLRDRGDWVLVLEDVGAESLAQRVTRRRGDQRPLPARRLRAWGRQLAAMLAVVHGSGLVHRDLKASNVVVATGGQLRLIDFELATEVGRAAAAGRAGTRGYMSPQQHAGAPATVGDDIYGLGALLYYLATGAEPAHAPDAFRLLARPPAVLNPALDPVVAAVIARCLQPRPADRFPSAGAVVEALSGRGARSRGRDQASSPAPERAGGRGEARFRRLARRLGDTLCRAAGPAPGAPGAAWTSTHYIGKGARARYLNAGTAGTVLALAELVAALDRPSHAATLEDGVRWLLGSPRHAGDPLPGLYVGEAGVGAALLRAGQVLCDPRLIDAAAGHGRWVATLPFGSPDLFHGTAGRARLHLLLWDETGDPAHLRAARAAGRSLLAAADGARGEARWVIPAGYEGLAGRAFLGYAHGAAGIADVLLDLFEATRDERFLATALRAARWLVRQTRPALDDGRGANWPAEEGTRPGGAFWCHGAAGVGQFFLHAVSLGVLAGARSLAERAARTVARGTRWAGPTQCHGLAGSIEFLLDAARGTGDAEYLAEARTLGRLLEAFAVERNGDLLWPSEDPATFTPDYMVGYAGVALCLLRLADPSGRPRQLTRAGFRQGRAPVVS